MKIAHTADIHIRSLDRHDEYEDVLNYFADNCKERNTDVAFLGGDIFHTKTQGISPEYIDFLSRWLRRLARSVKHVIIILGNHDGNLMNRQRKDAVSPIVEALNLNNVFVFQKSGVYQIEKGFNLCVFSIFDENGWDKVKPIEGEINIAAYHGGVVGATTNSWIVESEITPQFFDAYDICLLGDIHKTQFLSHRKGVPWIAYPGTPVQQNYDEDANKCYLEWNIKSKTDITVTKCSLPNRHPFVTLDYTDNESFEVQLETVPLHSRIRIRHTELLSQQTNNEIHLRIAAFQPKDVVFQSLVNKKENKVQINNIEIEKQHLVNDKSLVAIIDNYKQTQGIQLSQVTLSEISNKIKLYISKSNIDTTSTRKWKLKRLEWDNTFSYDKSNCINFENLSGIVGILGPNKSGKSSIVGTLLYALFNSTDRGSLKNIFVCNKNESYCSASAVFEADGKTYIADRITSKKYDKKGISATTNLNLFEYVDDKLVDMCEESRIETEKTLQSILGTLDDTLATSISTQFDNNNFINSGSAKRKSIISKHFGLNILQNIFEQAAKDLSTKKALCNSYNKNVGILLENARKTFLDLQEKIPTIEQKKSSLELELVSIGKNIEYFINQIDERNYLKAKQKFDQAKKELSEAAEEIATNDMQISNIRSTIQNLKKSIETIDLHALEIQLKNAESIQQEYQTIANKVVQQQSKIDSMKRHCEILKEVPCGNQFSECVFIRDAVKSQAAIEYEINQFDSLSECKNDLQAKRVNTSEIISKITVYNNSIRHINFLENKCSSIELKQIALHEKKNRLDVLICECKVELDKFSEIDTESIIAHLSDLKQNKLKLEKKLQLANNLYIDTLKEIGKLQSDIEKFTDESQKLTDIYEEMKVYEILVETFNKKAIPAKVLDTQLPILNENIRCLLNGIVDFRVEVAHDTESDYLEVFVYHDDTPILIELCSGMEKTIASIAIRVALSRITQVAQTNFLIIDEGFGTLDATGIEACNRFIKNLKQYYDFICIITHIDSVKDMADEYIEIHSENRSHVEAR